MAKKAKRDRSFVIKCAHCFETDFKLLDVKPDEKVKLYTDTPYKLGVFTPGGNFMSSNRDSSEQQKDLTPCKFQGNDESTAFKSHMINSSNGKLMNSLDKYEDPQIALRKASLIQVEEEKHESEQDPQSRQREQSILKSISGESLHKQMMRLKDSRKSLLSHKKSGNRVSLLENEEVRHTFS